MAHVDDLTLLGAAQLLASDNLYIGRPGDPDPDARTRLEYLAQFLGGSPDLIAALSTALPIESGSWTPTLKATSTNPTVTYTTQQGNYVRIGPIAVISLDLVIATISGGSGNARITDMPILPKYGVPLPARVNQVTYSGEIVAHTFDGTSTNLFLLQVRSNNTALELPISGIANGGAIRLSGAFEIVP